VLGLAVFSIGSQGALFLNESSGMVTEPGKDVGDGITVAVAVAVGGTGVNVGGMGEGVSVGGTGVDNTPQPNEAVSNASTRKTNPIEFFIIFFSFSFDFCDEAPNGLRYLRVGGRGFCLGAGKTRSEENARKCRRIPHVRCTLC